MYHTFNLSSDGNQGFIGKISFKSKGIKKRQLSTMEGKKKHEESRKRSHHKKIIEDQLLRDELSQLRKKVCTIQKKLDVSLQKLKQKNEEIYFLQEELEMSRTQDADQLVSVELEEEENLPISCYKECMQVIDNYLGDAEAIKKMIQLEKEDFHQLVEETGASIEQVTNRGTSRVRDGHPSAMATIYMVFITLFWLANYPTLSFMSSLFHLHERGITKILKRCLIGMAAILKHEVQWPSDEEFDRMKENFAYFQNWNFQDMVCVIDDHLLRAHNRWSSLQ